MTKQRRNQGGNVREGPVARLVASVGDRIARRRLLPDGGGAVVAVSGGRDSMVLLDVLGRLGLPGRMRVVVAHFAHGLRPGMAEREEALVREAASALGIDVVTGRAEGGDYRKGRSVEMEARRLRMRFLVSVARELGLTRVATGHHADDRAELFFLRLFRGASGAGLSGLRWERPVPGDPSRRLVSPLLGCRRGDLEVYAREAGVRFLEDPSNADPSIPRSRVRLELFPFLRERFAPGLDAVVGRTLEIVEDEADFVNREAEAWLAGSGVPFEALHRAVQRRVLHLQLERAGIPGAFRHVEALRLRPGCWFRVTGDVRVRREASGTLSLREVGRPAGADDPAWSGETLRWTLTGTSGGGNFLGGRFSWALESVSGAEPRFRAGIELLDADRLGDRLELRCWRPGDRFRPLGMSGSMKLQDWFVNRRVPSAERRRKAVLVGAGGRIAWVEGGVIGDDFRLDPGVRRVFKWCWLTDPDDEAAIMG